MEYKQQQEARLADMRRALRLAHDFERTGQQELAQGWGAVAANKLSIVVSQQYHVLDMGVEAA